MDTAMEVETVETGPGDVVEIGTWVEEMMVEEMMVVVIETEWWQMCRHLWKEVGKYQM